MCKLQRDVYSNKIKIRLILMLRAFNAKNARTFYSQTFQMSMYPSTIIKTFALKRRISSLASSPS